MLKPLSANIGDLGDYINCKIGQTPQLFHSQIGYTTAPGNALTHTVTIGRKGRIPGQLLSFPLRGLSSPAIVQSCFRPSYTYMCMNMNAFM